MGSMKEYRDYGEYLEEAYEKWMMLHEEKRVSVSRQDADCHGNGRKADNGNRKV